MPEVLPQMLNYVIAIYIRLSAEDGDLSDEKSETILLLYYIISMKKS